MMPIYVILVDGQPYLDRNDSAIRTYGTMKTANKSAQALITLGKRYSGSRVAGKIITIGEFSAVNVVNVEVAN